MFSNVIQITDFETSNSKNWSEILLINNSQKLKSPQDLLQEVSQRLKR